MKDKLKKLKKRLKVKSKPAGYWKEHLGLKAHPEGGWYKEIYRSELIIAKECLPENFSGNRAVATSIYFLLEKDNVSRFHRIRSDEIWHFYAGDPVHIHLINVGGELRTLCLGNEPEKGCYPQQMVPAGYWFASESTGEYSLAGCTVSPGFDFEDFEMADRKELSNLYPRHIEIIKKFT
jgi:predicted cupin superfamily sugar epimerase